MTHASLDAVWRDFTARLPDALRAAASRLPFDLGIAASPNGGWAEYTRLEPMRDLPSFAAEPLAADGRTLDAAALERYRVAHFHAGFFGLAADRVADGQDRPDGRELRIRLIARLRDAWRASLAAAVGDAAVANGAVGRAIGTWALGLRAEAEARAAGALSPDAYVALARWKVRWLAETSCCLLEAAGEAGRIGALLDAFELLLLASQLVDDAGDCEEDRRLVGAGAPDLLGLSADALRGAAGPVLVAAAAAAARGGFARLAAWIGAHRATMLAAGALPASTTQAIGAVLIAEAARRPLPEGGARFPASLRRT